jgi:hypothetical protein
VILALVFQIVFMYGASFAFVSQAYTATADKLGLLSGLVEAGQQITAPDPGGGFLGLLMVWLGKLIGG